MEAGGDVNLHNLPAGSEMHRGKCGCWHSTTPRRTPWFYKPQRYYHWWSPIWLGSDEWRRRTLVIGWSVTGQLVIPLRECRGCPGCRPNVIDGCWLSFAVVKPEDAERYAQELGH